MKFNVINRFIDREDSNHLYEKGSTYPRSGYKPNNDRIKALSTKNNASFSVLIEPVKEEGTKHE